MEMSAKKRRTVEADLTALLKPTAWMPKLQAYKTLDLIERLRREIRTPGGHSLYFSEKGLESFLRLSDTMEEVLPSRSVLEPQNIHVACKTALGHLREQDTPSRDIVSYMTEVDRIAQESISTHRFYTSLAGLEFDGVDEFSIGYLSIQRPDLDVLKSCVAYDDLVTSTWKQMQQGLWVTAEVAGSFEYAERRFFDDVKNACGLLAVSFTTVLERGGAAVRLIPSMDGRFKPGAVSWFSFSTTLKVLRATTNMVGFQRLTFGEEHKSGLLSCDWYHDLVRITQNSKGSDAELAVRRAIYWFFDAQTDTSPEMQLVKFWSCIECIFSIGKSDTTKKIKRGVTAILTYGQYRFSETSNWKRLEKEIGHLYDLRCGAVHMAEHSHVKAEHVTTLSKWAAWVLLEVVQLITDGFDTRVKIKAEVDRVHGLRQADKAKPD
ncbi:HEPN domain-containing protein [Pseudomonas aeruginosa]|uniref:HEPN domain-containing protein n=1 Tax=Pseudomonas aeruginosa TaxID=287 RepID=UPI000ADA7E73|nr:HEPN domain-containing protein [Pseudomonas aeruginosa]MCC0369099.1 hypothetical protein [Pseudomonas aeruginosa]MCG3032958.1 HEPN domain-containing protein [Pseudomonas aeruginosa]MCS7556502.1 HEPN domain-containing protein [Pseudomonas aeruginosa]MCS7581578.1 HEPN domain-containing protein [Pseudomonas aeruginosa]MCS7594117.1 HEPN domain-containing protein [Pseudomonas aeruginosa]